eukprot:CAMPEP_0171455884 /NCGR_PEP_ID=MMETSP0945-20130129/2594_1 /TAXON_ID=109269 /ORGANISM="Vaucheria litorea, Strain CCMP2940" /LENGTH=164 /DNA_ID=CAMNT_0011981201 /DNA_START=118 /DNA_END=612 /DNA_ORIENTATION=-
MELSDVVQFRANIQKVLKPGVWIPVLRSPHNWKEEWSLYSTKEDCLQDIKNAVTKLQQNTEDLEFQLDYATESKVQISCLTKSRWLDQVIIKLSSESSSEKTKARVYSFSTGVIPLTVVGSPLLNPLLCWFPFYDMEFSEKTWLPKIRDALETPCEVVKKGRAL